MPILGFKGDAWLEWTGALCLEELRAPEKGEFGTFACGYKTFNLFDEFKLNKNIT